MRWPRYFVKIDMDETVRWLARLGDGGATGEAWNGSAWIPTESVMDSLVGGDPLFDEITEETARTVMPAAFAGL